MVTEIVEEKDAGNEIRKINEVNTGIMLIDSIDLKQWLPTIENNNVQSEYYLTDLVKIANNHKVPVVGCRVKNPIEVEGINDKKQLALLERLYQQQLVEKLMVAGATVVDPGRIDIRGEVQVGQDCYIDVNAVFEGSNQLGNGVEIGPNCVIINSRIGNNTIVKANSILENTVIGDGCEIGPFARLRPGTELKENAKIGNFVETKNTVVGVGSKANHLTYLGDSELGKNVNIGAGTITCNYDGANKHKTKIGDNVFVGSNSALVAPISLGSGSTIGAGSTISLDAKENVLVVTRGKQTIIENWKRPEKKK